MWQKECVVYSLMTQTSTKSVLKCWLLCERMHYATSKNSKTHFGDLPNHENNSINHYAKWNITNELCEDISNVWVKNIRQFNYKGKVENVDD